MKIRNHIATCKNIAAEKMDDIRIWNPVRVRKEIAHNDKLDAAIRANGGQMPKWMSDQTLVAQILRAADQ